MSGGVVLYNGREGARIGARWTPDRVERRDTSTGSFELVNPMAGPDAGYIDLTVQRALLQPVKDSGTLARIDAARNARRVQGGAQ